MRELLGATYDDVLKVVRSAKRRWRLRVALRGLAIVLGFGFLAFAASVWGMDLFLYSERAIFWFRVFTYTALTALVVRFLVLPLGQRVSDERVALYIEEHEPSLQAALLSALELGREGEEAKNGRSPDLSRRLVADVVEKCRDIDYGQRIERSRLRRLSASVAGIAGAGMIAVLLSPAFLQHGAMLLFAPWEGRADNPYRVLVAPGDVEVARGADVELRATLVGFDFDPVEVAVKSGEDGEWQRWPMGALPSEGEEPSAAEAGAEAEGAEYDFLLLNLQEATEYFVEASTVRSPLYRIDVVDLPYVERIDLEYRFPAYTGLETRLEEDSGDIVALQGTEVEVRVLPTMGVDGGRLVLSDDSELALEPIAQGLLAARIDVERPGYYRVELESRGAMHRASSEYSIQVLDDQPPMLRFRKPGRDVQAHKIDEIFVEIEAEDDYGLGRVELVYSVNGGDEVSRVLDRGGAGRRDTTVGHTFFLEEIELEDGDFVAYYGRARDASGVGGGQATTSDIYFIEIRPFGKDYRRQEQGAGGGQGQGLDNTLSLTQRQIISATFNLIRDRRDYSDKEYGENLATLALSQGRLKEQVDTLVGRMQARAPLMGDENFQAIISALQEASERMPPAEEALLELEPKRALPFEQEALKYLQRAENVFRDVRVSFDPSAGSGGGPPPEISEDLADLFELELDKLRNQYETVRRGEQQQAEQEIDEAMQRLRELARRQQQENERVRRRLGQPGGMGSARNQEELIEETEELARKLERLSRERGRPELMESARRLQEAADSMRRAQANRSDGSVGQGVEALDELREARRLLDKTQSQRVQNELEELGERAQRIGEMQDRIRSELRDMSEQERAGGEGESTGERMERLLERKDRLGEEVSSLESQLDRMARQAREDNPEASRSLQQAADSIRDNQLKEKIRYSKGVAQQRDDEYVQLFEQEIESDIEELGSRIGEARQQAGESPAQQQAEALERARELVESLQSLESRLRERTTQEAGEAGRGQAPSDRLAEAGEPGSEGTPQPSGPPGEESRSSGEPGESGEGESSARERRLAQSGEQPGSQQGEGEQAGGAGARQPGQEGQPGAPDRQASGSVGGQYSQVGPSAGTRFQPGTLTAEEMRQFGRELDERLREGRQLREQLRAQGLEVSDLDQILGQMSRLSLREINNDPLALGRLQGEVVEGLKQFEFRLWRELAAEGEEKLFLGNSDYVPEGYRELVEEYYRSLSGGR